MSLSTFPEGGTAVVLGAGGGIGAAVLAALRARPDFAAVRGFGRTSTPPLDLLDESSIAAVADVLAADAHPPRLIFDATGVLHGEGLRPEKTWRHITPEAMAHAFAVNVTGPALLMKHLLPLLPRSGKAVFATLSARVGSIADNGHGGWYAYRASKAALNQIVRTAAIELGRRRPDALCVALHPGTVDTPLTRPFAKTGLAVRTPDVAADDLLAVLDHLEATASGGFFDQHGAPIPW
mgnify:CR=1 FL=1